MDLWDAASDQKQTPHCTLFAISRAISECCKEFKFTVSSEKIRQYLQDLQQVKSGIGRGWKPGEFNKLTLPRCMNDDGAIRELKIMVALSEEYDFNSEHVVWDNRKTKEIPDHCMYVLCLLEQYKQPKFLCLDSATTVGERKHRFPTIPTNKNGNELYHIRTVVQSKFTSPKAPV